MKVQWKVYFSFFIFAESITVMFSNVGFSFATKRLIDLFITILGVFMMIAMINLLNKK
ncbi:hypothetical protein ACSXAP_04800 [Clostridium perfringens]